MHKNKKVTNKRRLLCTVLCRNSRLRDTSEVTVQRLLGISLDCLTTISLRKPITDTRHMMALENVRE